MHYLLYSKNDNFPKGETADTTNLYPGDLLHLVFEFYCVTSICVFTSMINGICAKTQIIWILTTTSKQSSVGFIRFILITFNNEKRQSNLMRFDKDGTLEKTTYVNGLIVDEFNAALETTGGYASRINGNNERQSSSIKKMVRAYLLNGNQNENKWFYEAETYPDIYRCKIYSSLDNASPHLFWYGKCTSIHELRASGCDIYTIKPKPKKLENRTQEGQLIGYINSRARIKWWDPHNKKIKHYSPAKSD